MKRSGVVFILTVLSMFFLGANSNAQKKMVNGFKAKSFGVPASPDVFSAIQSNGEKIQLYIKGDGASHWYETTDGYTILKNKNNDFVYAIQDKNKNLVPSNVVFSNSNNKSSRDFQFIQSIPKRLRFSKKQIIEQRNKYQVNNLKSSSAGKAFPTTGNRNVLLILIDFPDRHFNKQSSDFENLMNETGYNGTGSFKDFYLTSSYNQLTLTTTVIGWYRAADSLAYYGGNDKDGYDERPRELVREAIDSANANGIDFSIFDNDGDGEVDGIQVIHAGYGEESGASEDCIWSHQWELYDLAANYDGVRINDYAIYPELRGNLGANMTNIGVVCHEFGHSLGLPDFYDTDYSESGGQSFDLGEWDMMAGGSWNNDGAVPANHNCFSKWELGWLNPIELKNDTSITNIPNVLENDTAYIIYSQVNNEFFMLENRQQLSFDEYVPGHGLLIYHYDGNNWSELGNIEPDHQCMDIEEADNVLTPETYAGDPFPGTSNRTEFTDATTPNMLAWDDAQTKIGITNITENNTLKTISFNVVTGDVSNPVVRILSEYDSSTTVHPIPMKVVFNEPVFGFESNDISITNGNIQNFTSLSDSLYTFNLEPNLTGQVYVSIGANIAEDIMGFGNNASDQWSIIFGNPVSINNVINTDINIYPNPSNGIFNIEFSKNHENGVLKIVDLTGRIIYFEKITETLKTIDISKHSKGIYILSIQVQDKYYNYQILIK